MNANRQKSFWRFARNSLALFAAGSALIPAFAVADNEGTAPSMFGIKEIVIEQPRFGDVKSARNCGLDQQEVADALRKSLQQNGLPAMSAAEAPPSNMGIARLYIFPEVYTDSTVALACVSWISLWAESHTRARIPPVDISRNLTITYWHQGTMIAGDQSQHGRQVVDSVSKLATDFADQFKLDQPPPGSYP